MPPLNIEITASVDSAIRDLALVNDKFDAMKKVNQDAAGALGVFGVSLTSLSNPLTFVAGALKDSMDTADAWGQTVQKLAAESGQSAKEASTMAAVFGDLGVSTDNLNSVVKAFTKNGLEFNLDTIKKLATQYQALPPGVERNEFAFKNFGRSGNDLNEILTATPDKLQALADKAQYSGKVIDDKMVKSLEDARTKTKEFGDQVDGAKVQLGAFAIDTVSKAEDGFHNLVGTYNAMAIAVEAHTGLITWDEAAARANAAAQGDLFAALHDQTQAYRDNLTAQENAIAHVPTPYVAEAARVYSDAALIIAGYTDNVNLQATSQNNAKVATDAYNLSVADQTAKVAEANAMTAVDIGLQGDLTTQIIFQAASEGLSAAGKLELARTLGLVNEKTYAATVQIEAWKAQVDAGTLSQDAYTLKVDALNSSLGKASGIMGAAAGAALNLNDKIAALHDKIVNVTVMYHDTGLAGEHQSDNTDTTTTTTTQTPPGGKYAGGADFIVPLGYSNDSFPMRVQSGEHVQVTPAGQSSQSGHTFQFFVDARGATNPAAVEAAGYRGAMRAMKDAGYRSDQFTRMGTN